MDTQPATTPVPRIHAAIVAVMSEIGAIEKNKKNEQQNFMFRGVGDAMAACQPLFVKHNIYIRPIKVTADHTKDLFDRDGKPRTGSHSRQTIVYRVTSAEDGSFIDCEATGEAMDFGDKATGKVLSVSFKFLIFQLFCIPDHNPESDPDGQSPGISPPSGEAGKKPLETKATQGQAQKPAEKKTSPLKDLIATLKKCGKEKPADVLGWMTAQLKKTIKATKDLTEAEIAQLTESANAILKETT
jgi:hypothetical protein